jgi:carboxyl-terminal processing protease
VVLTIRRQGVPDKDYTLTRAMIKVASVMGFERDKKDTSKWNYMIDPDSKIGYIRLTQFQSESAQQLKNTLTELQDQGMRGVIMDLRYNPGGLLPAAINISDMFLQDGTIVSTRGRSVSPEKWTAKDDPVIPPNMPLIVLVNQYSASASEIYSGAMKDLHRGLIVGHRTFGKFSVQHLLPMGSETLSDGSPAAMMKLTMAHYYLPNNESRHRNDGSKVWGVDPDVPVDMTPEQMNDLREAWHDVEIIHRPGEPAQTQPATTKKTPFDDTQLDTALMMMRLQLIQAGPG